MKNRYRYGLSDRAHGVMGKVLGVLIVVNIIYWIGKWIVSLLK